MHDYLFKHVSPLDLAGFDKATGIKADGVFEKCLETY